jgi:hypothetical protein
MFLETLAQDARFALRILSRTPAFATTVVLTLGVGLGLNTMLFTLFNAYVLRPAAVHDPYSLYQLAYSTQRVRTRPTFSWDQYQAIRSHSPALTDAIASEEFFARVDNRSLDGLLVSGNYFTMLGVATSIGRPILPDDAATEGTGRVMVLSHQMWKSEFGADPAIVGRKILVNAQPLVVIGPISPGSPCRARRRTSTSRSRWRDYWCRAPIHSPRTGPPYCNWSAACCPGFPRTVHRRP